MFNSESISTNEKQKNSKDLAGVFCCVHLCCLVGLWDFCIVHSVHTLPVGCCGTLSSQLFD